MKIYIFSSDDAAFFLVLCLVRFAIGSGRSAMMEEDSYEVIWKSALLCRYHQQ
jgi:hypothetical protein